MSIRVIKNALSGFSSQRAVYGELEKTGRDIHDYAGSIVPVDTGELQESGFSEGNGQDTVITGYAAEHAAHVELGTRHQAAQPYLLPAFESETDSLPERIGRAIKAKVG